MLNNINYIFCSLNAEYKVHIYEYEPNIRNLLKTLGYIKEFYEIQIHFGKICKKTTLLDEEMIVY